MPALETEEISTATQEEVSCLANEQEHKSGALDDTSLVNSGEKNDVEAPLLSRTLALIKPDAMKANRKDEIISKIEENKFTIVQEQQLLLSKEKAGLFYKEHDGKPFYQGLTDWMSSAPIYAMILEKHNAVQSWRDLMGPTDSNKARDIDPNSIRALFGADGSQNATHGSDSQESADREIALIFDNDDSTEKAASHVPETHGLVDEVDAHGACKPETASGAEDENQQNQSYLPEVIKTPDFGYNNDTKNVADANVETTVNIDHLQTADVVSSEEHIIDLSQKDDVQAFNVIPEKTVEAPAIIEQKEAVPTYQGVVSLDATIDVTLQETAAVTNVAQPDATTSSTDILSNIKEDATSPNDTKQAEANFEPIENTPILEQQEVIEHETVTLDSVDLEQESKTKNLEAIIHYESKTVDIEAKPNVDQEPIDAVQDTEEAKNLHENDVVVEAPVAIATATETSQDTSKLDVEESIVDSGNVDEQAKQDESANDTSAIINQSNETSKECVTTDNVVCAVIDINAATTIAVTNQGDDESAVVSGVTFEENEVQADVVVHNDEKNPTAVTTIEHADIVQDVKSVECVIQENGAEEGDPISTTLTTATTTLSNDDSNGQLSKNSSVTEKNQVKEETTKETNVSKKQPKLRAPGVASTATRNNNSARPANSTVATPTATDKKKAITNTGIKKPAPAIPKKPAEGDEKPKAKTRVPRFASLSQPKKKPDQDDNAATIATDVKTKKASTSTRSLVSRLTAPTAASARKKILSADDGSTLSSKPADLVRQKKAAATTTKKVPSSTAPATAAATVTATGSRGSKTAAFSKPSIPVPATATKKPSTTATTTLGEAEGSVRRTSPPTSKTVTEKVGRTIKRTTPAGTRATASGLPSATNGKSSTRKETLSTNGSKHKKSVPTAVKKSTTNTPITPKAAKTDATLINATTTTATTSSASSASSALASTSTISSSLNCHTTSDDSEASKLAESPGDGAEDKNQENEKSPEQVQDNGNNINDADSELINEIKVTVACNNEQNEKATAVDSNQDNQQEVKSLDIITKQPDDVVIVEPSLSANKASDAEVAAITTKLEVKKPQMASLRSKFENLNNNTNTNSFSHYQLHTTSSKEIRSKSPNRISDMINRFQ